MTKNGLKSRIIAKLLKPAILKKKRKKLSSVPTHDLFR